MSTTRTVSKGTMTQPSIFIPAPDLLDLVKHWLPGDAGTSAVFSIVGGLAFRCAALAGQVANALTADARAEGNGVDSYNETMAQFDEMAAAQYAFENAGLDRKNMCQDLTNLLGHKRVWDDYLAQLVGDRYKPTNWLETFTMVAQPRAVDQWSIDDEWNTYLEQLNGAAPEMEKAEFDKLSIAALQGPRAAWAKHVNAVFNILEAADSGDTVEFFKLEKRAQFALLTKYGSPEQLGKFRINIKRSMMGRPPMEILGRISLYKAFAAACTLATTHHRYNDMNGSNVAPTVPVKTTPKQIAAKTKERKDLGKHAEYIAESVNAEKRAHAQAVIDNKAAATKRKPSVKRLADLAKLEPETKPTPALTAKQIANQPIVDHAKTTTLPFVDMPNSVI